MTTNNTLYKLIAVLLCLGIVWQTGAQTLNDGAMNIRLAVGASWVESVDDPLTGELNANEFRWKWWGADNANLDGSGFLGGTTIGTNTSSTGWVNTQDVNLLNYTYGTPGSTPVNVPQYLMIQGEAWEDDCFDCYRSTGFLQWQCDQCSDQVYDGNCGCSTNILCGCSAEDQHVGPATLSNTINYRAIAPCLTITSPPTVGNAWVGDIFTNSFGSDDIGAQVLASYTPPIPAPIVSTASTLCNAGLVTLQTNGAVFGGDYRWYDNGTNLVVGIGAQITPFVGTTTTFRVHTFNGSCESLSYRLITINVGTPTITSVASTNPLCSGGTNGTITVTATGGTAPLEYSKDGGANYQTSNVFTGLAGGFYNIVVRDANGCSAIYSGNSVVLTQPQPVNIFVNKVDAACNGASSGRIDIFAGGGSGNLQFSVDGGSTWQPSSIFANLPSGSYNVAVQDANNCTYQFLGNPVVLSQPAAVTASATVVDASCAGNGNGSITVSAAGGTSPYNYSLNNGPFFPNSTFTALPAGSYNILVSDVNGCLGNTNATVATQYTLTASIQSQTDVSCAGGADGTVTVAQTGGVAPLQYSIDGGNSFQASPTFGGLNGGNYTVMVQDANGCQASATVTIIEKPTLALSVVSVTNTNCFTDSTGSITVAATGGDGTYNYVWNTTATGATISNVPSGSYVVTVTDGSGCSTSLSATVNSPAQLFASIGGNDPACFGDATGYAVVDVSGGTPPYTYAWSSGQTTLMAVKLQGNVPYTVTVTDAKGCTISSTITLEEPTPVSVSTTPTNVTCFAGNNGTVTLAATGGTPGYEFTVNGIFQTNPVFSNLPAGDYTVVAEDINNCVGTTQFSILQPSAFPVSAGPDVVSVKGQPVVLNGSASSPNGITSFVWSPNVSLTCTACQSTTANPDSSFVYVLTATDGIGCTATDSVLVIVKGTIQYFVPTAFTPNGDKLNDKFTFDILGANKIDVSVFNRWGDEVYRNAEQLNGVNSDGWDGTKDGKKLPFDTYVYQLKVTFFDNSTEVVKGTVTMMQ
jgi:gliding motility-associated-like protein